MDSEQESETEVNSAVQNVARYAAIASAAESTSADRHTAYQYISEFQSTASPELILKVSMKLILALKGAQDTIVVVAPDNHSQNLFTGLQLLKFCIMYKWSQLGQNSRHYAKTMICEVVTTQNIPVLPFILKQNLATVIAEIAKKEWPQVWPGFLPFMMDVRSSPNRELIFMVFQGLAEDVFILQNIDHNERKKDLTHSISHTAAEIVQAGFEVMDDVEVARPNEDISIVNIQLAKSVLSCLSVYAEFTDQILWTENRIVKLLKLFCNEPLKSEAVACVVQLLERQGIGKKDDKNFIIKPCLSSDGLGLLKLVVINTAAVSLNENDQWIQRLESLLLGLATNSTPKTEGIVELFELLSLLLYSADSTREIIAVKALYGFLQKNQKTNILDNKPLTEKIIQLIKSIILVYFLTNNYPQQYVYFKKISQIKSEFTQLVRIFGQQYRQLYLLISEFYNNAFQTDRQHFLEGFVTLIDLFSSTVTSVQEQELAWATGMKDFEFFGNRFINESDLILKSFLLSGVSGTFRFIALSHEANKLDVVHQTMVRQILLCMFECYKIEDTGHGDEAKSLKKHVTSLLQKLVAKYPKVMNLVSIELVSNGTGALQIISTFDFCGLVEVMLTASNEWVDVEQQQKLVEVIVSQIDWNSFSTLSTNLKVLVDSLVNNQNQFEINRAVIIRGLTIIQALICRLKHKNGSIGAEVVKSLLPHVFELIKSIHGLLDDPQLSIILDPKESEKNQILGINPHGKIDRTLEKSNLERIQATILNAYELGCAIIGEYCCKHWHIIYSIDNISEIFASYVAFNFHKLNNYRLRNMIKLILIPFMISCPPELFDSAVKPFFQSLASFLFQHFVKNWNSANIPQGGVDGDGEDNILEESVELAILSLTTKEYFDLLIKMITVKQALNSSSNGNNENLEAQAVDKDDEMEVDGPTKHPNSNAKANTIGELGECLLKDTTSFDSIVSICICALRWLDSKICEKALRIVNLCWERIKEADNPLLVQNLLTECTNASVIWVNNEINIDAIQRLVDKIIFYFLHKDGKISEILVNFGVKNEDIMKMYNLHHEPKSEKRRKDLFLRWVKAKVSEVNGTQLKVQWLKGLPRLSSLLKAEDGNIESMALLNKLNSTEKPLDLKGLFSR